MRILSLKSLLALFLTLMFLVIGCDEPEGFGVQTRYEVAPNVWSPYYPVINGSWLIDIPPTNGGSILGFVNKTAPYYVNNGRAPASWEVTISVANPGLTPCVGQGAPGTVKRKTWNTWWCGFVFRGNFRISPEIIVTNAYNTITVSGDGISGTYGMPKVFFYDTNGVLIGEATASSYGSGWLSGSVWIPSVPDGDYMLLVGNSIPGGGYEDIGGATFTVYTLPPPPPVCDPDGTEAAACSASGGIYNYTTCHCDCACG